MWAIHAASGVGYGEGFAGNAHRHVGEWVDVRRFKFLVEDIGMDVNARDHNGYTAVHHAAARGDNEDDPLPGRARAETSPPSVVGASRTADMANAPCLASLTDSRDDRSSWSAWER